MSMTTNSNTADDAIFDSDSATSQTSTPVQSASPQSERQPRQCRTARVRGVADGPCAEPVPAPEVAWLSSSPAARA